MKKVLKVFAFIGGIGAVGWLLQNRIVTVTMSREPMEPELAPEPPAAAGAAPEVTPDTGSAATGTEENAADA